MALSKQTRTTPPQSSQELDLCWTVFILKLLKHEFGAFLEFPSFMVSNIWQSGKALGKCPKLSKSLEIGEEY